ncbi:hypothetical protein GCM10027047_06280 [Rhodococcus aerolatus]
MSAPTRSERPTTNPAGAVYGTVIVGSLIVAEGSQDDVDLGRLVLLVLATQVVYWLAHVYSEVVALRIEARRAPTWAEVGGVLRSEWALVAASFGPLLVIGVGAALGLDAEHCVLAALWAIPVVLAGWALVAARRSAMRTGELLLYVVLSAGFGVALVVLKALFH